MGSVLNCFWEVSVNGKALDRARIECVDSIDIIEQCDGSDTCTLTLNDPEFLFIEDNIFIEEATVSVTIWFEGITDRITFDGFISAIDIDFPDKGFPVLSVFCLDGSHVMNRKKNSRSWDNVTSADVVQIIAQEHGFNCAVEAGYEFEPQDTISQSRMTDIVFCEVLASRERDPFMCKLVGDTLYYVKKGVLKDPSTTLFYKEFPHDVISFRPRINKETRLEEVTVADIVSEDKSVDSATASDDMTIRDTQGEPVRVWDDVNRRWDQKVR